MTGERVVIESGWGDPKPCRVRLTLETEPLDAIAGSTKESIDLAVRAAEGAMLLEQGAKITITYEETEGE